MPKSKGGSAAPRPAAPVKAKSAPRPAPKPAQAKITPRAAAVQARGREIAASRQVGAPRTVGARPAANAVNPNVAALRQAAGNIVAMRRTRKSK